MKTLSDLQATDPQLTVRVDDQTFIRGLHDLLVFDAENTVTIDGIEILPKYIYLINNGVLTIDEPFYCWYHRISGQGWLLAP
jgi:hypothetical protein